MSDSTLDPQGNLARVDARANRERILEAARTLLRDRGFEVEVMEIANLAGVGPGTLYRHFPNKEALLRTIVDEAVAMANEHVKRVSATEDVLEAIVTEFRMGEELVDRYGMFALALFGGTAPSPFRNLHNGSRFRDALYNTIERGIKQGYFLPDLDVDFAVSWMLALSTPHAIRRLRWNRTPEDAAVASAQFFLAPLMYRPDIDLQNRWRQALQDPGR